MPEIKNYDEAKKLADRIFESWKDWHGRLDEWRALVDREMNDKLQAFADILPARLKERWWPYQSPLVQSEIQNTAHLLASNQTEIEIISKSSDSAVLKEAQALEEADEAILAETMDTSKRIQRYIAILGDAVCVQAWDIHEPGEATAAYGDRKALEQYAEGTEEPDEDDDEPPAIYRRAYQKHGDHEKAYRQVIREAMMADDLPIANRIIDPKQFAAEISLAGKVQIGVERSEIALSAALSLLEGYGVKQVGDRVMLTKDGKETDTEALTAERTAIDGGGAMSATETVEYTQIRTFDQHVICISGKGVDGKTIDGQGIFIALPNPFPGETTGYYLTSATEKIRDTITKRMEPFMLPLMVETQVLNAIVSGTLAIAWAEASREEYQLDTDQVPVTDATQETKSNAAPPSGQKPPVTGSEIKRVEGFGQDLKQMVQDTMARIDMYLSKEFYGGAASSGDSGRWLARAQTAQLTKLSPIQAKVSGTDKQMLLDLHRWIVDSKRTLVLAKMPALSKMERGDTLQVAEAREITPKRAKLPVVLQVTTGADTPEAKYGLQQVSREEVTFGTYGKSQHREIIGIKDPLRAEERMIEDQLTEMGIKMSVEALKPSIQRRAREAVDAIMPPPVMVADPSQIPPPGDPNGPPPPPPPLENPGGAGGQMFDTPVPMQPGGIPDVAGAEPMPQ